MFIDNRNIVAMSKIVGNDEKSKGRAIHSETIKIKTESAIEMERPMSIKTVGIGRKRMARMNTTPPANRTSRPLLEVEVSTASTAAILNRHHAAH